MALSRFAPARPVPVLHVHSRDDSRELYGEEFRPAFPITSAHAQEHPVELELSRWVDRDLCHAPAQIAERRASAPAAEREPAEGLVAQGCAIPATPPAPPASFPACAAGLQTGCSTTGSNIRSRYCDATPLTTT
jgi:hypothetical protein